MSKKIDSTIKEDVKIVTATREELEKEELLKLYDRLNQLGIKRISDLENKIANL